MSFIEMIERIDREHVEAHEKLKDICGQSERINYDGMLKRLNEIVGDIDGYKVDFFVNLLAEELEHSKIVNNGYWDMTIEEIENKYNNDMKYWDNAYKLYGDKDLYKDAIEFKECMMDWFLTYSLDGSYASVECEYKFRKDKGLIV
jgi:hypothetical protein